MKKRITSPLEAAVLTALMALLSLSLFAAPPAHPTSEEVVITGRLHVEDLIVDDAILVVEVDGKYCHFASLSESGRFTVALPAGSEATFRFMKPGHLPKEVVVNTTNFDAQRKLARHAKKVKFDVVLEPEHRMAGRAYAGPVGSIAFADGFGGLTVEHHERLVPKERLTTTEF